MSQLSVKPITDCFIDGQFVTGKGEVERVLNPSTGELLVEVREATVEQIDQAVKESSTQESKLKVLPVLGREDWVAFLDGESAQIKAFAPVSAF